MEISQHINRFTFVPNLFTLNIGDLSAAKLKVIQKKLEDKDDEVITDKVRLMNSNLLSFVLLLFGKYKDCERQNEIVLNETPSNINANVIKGLLCFKNGEITQAESYIDKIKASSEDDFLVTEAHAEIAYAYSRFGGTYYKTAIATYLKVTEKFPEVYEWKYRFALTIRRSLHNTLRLLNIDTDIFFPKCLDLLTDIIDNSSETNLIANAYVQKACLLMPINSSDTVLQKHGISNRHQTIVDNLDKAMDLTTEDAGMLQEVGRCLRNIKKFDVAKVILEKAINICPTSTSYHHLALCLIKLDGYSPDVVYTLERSVEMNDFNISKLDLGKAYMKLKIPDFTKALQCFEGCQANEHTDTSYGIVAQCYDLMAQCYFKMAKRRGVDRSAYMEKFQENRKRSVIEAAMIYLNALRMEVGDEQKLEIGDLFSNDEPRYGLTPKDTLLRFVYYNIQQNCDFIREIKLACLSGAASARSKRIQNYIQHGQLSECLDMMILIMTTNIPDIESKAIETIGQVIYESVLQSRHSITQNCISCTIRCFYQLEQNDCHVRIIHDDNSQTEADRMEDIMNGLDLRVIRNKLDILPFMNLETALLSAMSNNIVVLYLVKDNNTDLLEEYPVIRQLPISKPVLIPITVDDSFVPDILSSHTDPMEYPNTSLTVEQKAIWYKTLFEKIFNPFKSNK